jgi:glycosyltransferase involved in cell wall biosynthesis
MGEVSPRDVARALEALYTDPAHRQERSAAAGGVARNPAYSWGAITRQFDDLIVELATAQNIGRRRAGRR